MDPEGVPGAQAVNMVPSMGIGNLRVMTRVSRMGVAVTGQPPPEAVQAWDLIEIIDSAPVHCAASSWLVADVGRPGNRAAARAWAKAAVQ